MDIQYLRFSSKIEAVDIFLLVFQKLLERVVEQMKTSSSVHWVEGANHGLAVKGRAEESVLDEVNSQIVAWILDHV